MTALPQPQYNSDDDQLLPITPEIVEKITGTYDYGLNRSQKREHSQMVAELRRKHQSGVVVTVVESDGSVRIYQVKQFILGPAE